MSIIFDIGMHRGEDTDFYLKKGFTVVGVEANPALVRECRKRFQPQIENGQLHIVDKAIAEVAGKIGFFVCNKVSVWSTAEKSWMLRNRKFGRESTEIKVQATTLQDVIAEYGLPRYLKIDIEGSDLICVKALKQYPPPPKYLSIESHAYDEQETVNQLNLLRSLGYSKFKVIGQHEIHKQKLPRLQTEGQTIEHEFPSGASGLFGSELPGKWMSFDQTLNRYRKIYRQVAMFGGHTGKYRNIKNRYAHAVLTRLFPLSRGWYDTHATRSDNPDL